MALTAAEQAELAQLEAQYGAKPKASSGGLTPQEQAELAQLEAQYAEPEMGLGMKVLTGAGKALDYAGGVSRALVANAADAVVPGEMATSDDIVRALKANPFDSKAKAAKSTSEYMDTAGVPELGKLSDVLGDNVYSETGDEWLKLKRGGAMDPTGRGAIGFVGDIALDPTTYLTLGAGSAAKKALAAQKAERMGKPAAALTKAETALASGSVQKALRPLETLSQKLGRWSYKSGLKRIDDEALKYGKAPVSDRLMDEGITGSARSIYGQMDDLGEKLYQQQRDILKEASRKGSVVSMSEAMEPALLKAREISSRSPNPGQKSIADALEAEAQGYIAKQAPQAENLRQLYRQGDMVGGHTPIEVLPKKQVITELPVQAKPTLVDPGKVSGGDFIPQRPVTALEDMRGVTTKEGTFYPGQYKIDPTVPDTFTPREPVKVFDMTSQTPGKGDISSFIETPATVIDPLIANKYKSSITSALPDKAFYDKALMGEAYAADKIKASGMRQAIENAVERTTGRGKELKQINSELGGILTTKDKQLMDAVIEGRKNLMTSVDVPLAVLGGPQAWAAKKAADAAKTTWVRTKFGKALRDAGEKASGRGDIAARRLYWEMLRDKENTPQGQ